MAGLLPYLRLLRAGTLFSPAADVVAGLCITHQPWSLDAARAVFASVCLYAAGMVWNDIADRRDDATTRPERPLPRGDIALPAAVALGALLLMGGLLLSPVRWHHGLIAALVLAYDFGSKRSAVLGAANMGLLRALNLVTAAALLPHSDPWHGGSLPMELQGAAACYGVYILAVTILGIFEDLPRVSPRAVVTLQAAPPLVAWLGLALVQGGLWPVPALALLPVLVFARRNRTVATWDQAAIRRSMTWLLLGTMLYTALLCGAAGRWFEAAAIAIGLLLARRVARAIALT